MVSKKVLKSSNWYLKNRVDQYEPTYQLGPKQCFNRNEAENIIQNILSSFVRDLDSSSSSPAKTMESICKSSADLTTLINSRVKHFADKRYKIVVYKIVIDREYQGVTVATKCLWNADTDVCISVREDFKNYSIIVNLYADYHEWTFIRSCYFDS